MLAKTVDNLFTLLGTYDLYQEVLALDFVADTKPKVVRYNSSEYLALLSATPTAPFIALQRIGLPYLDTGRETRRGRVPHYGYLDDDAPEDGALTSRHPEPYIITFQLDIRSPHEIWLVQIETSLADRFLPAYDTTINAAPFGEAGQTYPFAVRYKFQNIDQVIDLEDDVRSRYLRSTYRIEAETWLLSRASVAARDVISQVESEVTHGATDAVLLEQTQT